MPPDRPLDEADVELIEQWILDGALKVGPGKPRKQPTTPISDGGVDAHDAATEAPEGGLDSSPEASDGAGGDATDAHDAADAHLDGGTDG
jgi:hypothetical protein